jgi:hypothetical protein
MEAKYLDQNVIIQAIPGITTAYVSNEYTDALEARIALCEKTIKGYDRGIATAQSYSRRAECMANKRMAVIRRNELTALLKFITECIELKNDDLHNNINRFCTIPGDRKPRQWRVVFAMQRNDKGWPQYLVRSIRDCDEFRVVSMIDMMNLY